MAARTRALAGALAAAARGLTAAVEADLEATPEHSWTAPVDAVAWSIAEA